MNTFIVIVIAATLAAACTSGKDVVRTKHEGPTKDVSHEGKKSEEGLRLGTVSVEKLKSTYDKRNDYIAQINDKGVSADKLRRIIKEFEPFILKLDYIENAQTLADDRLVTILSLFNKAVLRLFEIDPNSQSEFVDNYSRVVFAGCRNGFEGCTALKFFSRDALTSKVFSQIAKSLDPVITDLRNKRTKLASEAKNCKREEANCRASFQEVQKAYFTAVERFYNFLYLGVYDTKNGSASSESDLLYVRHASDYFEFFNHQSLQEKSYRKDYHKRHRDVLSTILIGLNGQKKNEHSRKEYCDFVIELKPYTFKSGVHDHFDKKGLKEFVSDFINCASERNQLNTIMSGYVKEEKTKAEASFNTQTDGKVLDISYFYALKVLAQTPYIKHNLGISEQTREDMFFYIIDRLFYEDIDVQVAFSYMQKMTNRNDAEILSFAKNYIRVQLAYVMKAAIVALGEQIKTQYNKSGSLTPDMFQNLTDDMNTRMQFEWDVLKMRINFIKELIVKVFDEKYKQIGTPADKKASELYLSLKEQLESLNDHLNIAVAGPAMLPVSYYMSKASGEIKFMVSWWRSSDKFFSLKGTEALVNIVEGEGRSVFQLFAFGSEKLSLDSISSFQNIDMALRTGVFDLVPLTLLEEDQKHVKFKGETLNNEYLFFRQYVEQRTKDPRSSLLNSINSIEAVLEDQLFKEKFLDFCEDPLRAPIMLASYADLAYYTTLSDKAIKFTFEKAYEKKERSQYAASASKSIAALLRIFHNHFYAPDAEKRLPPEKLAIRDQIYAAMKAEVDGFDALERKYYRKIAEMDRMIVSPERDCINRAVRTELFRRDKLLDANIEFYHDVHAGMSLLQVAEDLNKDLKSVSEIKDALQRAIPIWLAKQRESPSETIENLDTVLGDLERRMTKLVPKVFQPGLWDKTVGETLPERFETAINDVFGIHNNGEAPYSAKDAKGRIVSEVGYLVTGIPTAKEAKAIKRENKISKARFIQARFDTIMRVRRQLQTLLIDSDEANAYIGTNYPQRTKIALGAEVSARIPSFSELETDTLFYLNPHRQDASYQLDPDKFVRTVLIPFGGYWQGNQFTGWYFGSGTDFLTAFESRLSVLIGFMKESAEISDTDEPVCEKNFWNRATAKSKNAEKKCQLFHSSVKDVVKYYLSWADLINMDARGLWIQNVMDLVGINPEKAKKYFQYKSEPNPANWTWFDEFYNKNFVKVGSGATDRTAMRDALSGSWEMTQLVDDLRMKFRPNQHFFELSPKIAQIRRDEVRSELMNHLEYVSEFERVIRLIENEAQTNAKIRLPEVIFERDRSSQPRPGESYKPNLEGFWRYMPIFERRDGTRAGTPIYLRDDSQSAQVWFKAFTQSFFVKSAECRPLPQDGDPDYLQYKSVLEGTENLDCEARYLKWRAEYDRLHQN